MTVHVRAAALSAAISAATALTAQSAQTSTTPDEELQEVVVTGSYTTQSMNSATGLTMSLRETPQSVTVVTRQMIEDKGLIDMEEVLDFVPGVSKVGDASEDSIIYVRGFQLDSGVQVDGMITTPANTTYSGAISQGVDAVIAERVEVLKGAAGILNGLGEPSATVNMTRKRPRDDFQGSLSLSGGRWNTWRAEGDVTAPLSADGSVRGRFVGALMGNDSFIDGHSRKKNVLYGIVDKRFGQGTTLSLAADRVDQAYDGVYNWSSNPAYYTDGSLIDHDVSYSTGQSWSYRDVTEWSVMPEVHHDFGGGWTVRSTYRFARATIDVLNASLGSFVDRATGELVDPWGPPNALRSDRESEQRSFNLVTTGAFDALGRRHDLVLGYNYARNDFRIRSSYYDLPTVTLGDEQVPMPDLAGPTNVNANHDVSGQGGLYGTIRLALAERLKLMAGGRLSHWKLTSRDGDTGEVGTSVKKNGVFTPYFGVVFDVNDFASVYASHTGIFLPGTYYGADGNLLEPTDGTNTELGFKLAFHEDRLNLSAAVYEANKDKVPEWANEGQLPNGEWIYRSVDGIKTRGYEIEAAGSLTPGWDISGGFTHNKSKDKAGNVRTSYIPDDVFKITSSYRLAAVLPGLRIGGSARWQSGTYYDTSISVVDPPLDVRQQQKAYWLLDAMAQYAVSERMSVSANINNLLDERYNRSMWGYSDFGEPRDYSVTVRWRW